MKKYTVENFNVNDFIDFVDNIKWEDAARDFGVELAPGSIGYNVPTSWTSTPVLKDYEFFARTQCGRYLIINGEGKAWLGQPIDYKNTYGKPIFP
jgi:hypothetical protein